MPGLSPKIAVHHLAIKKGNSPKKQPQRRFRPELVPEIEMEVKSLWKQDDFPSPVAELMIDATTGHEALSFMDCTTGIKKYLASAPMLGAPIPGKPLVLYIAAQERSLGAMCAQEIEDRKEKALYYLSLTLVGAQLNYSPIEKICLALVFAIQKLRHYMQAYTIHVVSKADPIKYILSRPVLSGRLAKWAAGKGQAIANFFADYPVPAEWEISDDLPGEEIFYVDVLPPWQMYFDGAVRKDGAGAGARIEDLIPYHQWALQLLNQLDDIHVGHVPRSANKLADAHAKLAGTLALGTKESMQVPVFNRWVVSLLEGEENVDTTNMICVYTVDEDDWHQPIIDFMDHQKLPDDPRHKVEILRHAPKFIHYKGTLYRCSFSPPLTTSFSPPLTTST
ncbi:uncharacterized protein LOC141628960 [Silene latifolia]|uniref:uncharacterized protein LOC141628960 n=1 Tax=Silene latifolia TaxID=37657 RepID=UPI003D78873E